MMGCRGAYAPLKISDMDGDMTRVNDLVLVYFEDKPLVFARIEDISPDIKPNWYHLRLLILQVPVQQVTWILRDAYINGETFTMNGKKMRLERVVSPDPEQTAPTDGTVIMADKPAGKSATRTGAKIISITDAKKK